MSPCLYGIYTVPKAATRASMFADLTPLLAAGLPWLQIRDKQQRKQLWPIWAELARLCAQHRAQLIINDQLELAQWLISQSPATRIGIHLGQTDQSVTIARQTLGPAAIIGVTCHSDATLAVQAQRHGANYVAFGRFFLSETKPNAPAAKLCDLPQLLTQVTVPSVAIGGITSGNIAQVCAYKFALIAVGDSLFNGDTVHNLRILQTAMHTAAQVWS